MANANLHKAKSAKNDEFYTQLTDVSKELMHYKDHFKDKVVFCNCDDPSWSAFWRYFHLNFAYLGLKKLISTHYDREQPTFKMVYEGDNDNDVEVGTITPLEGNGDFRNAECIELLKEADVIVTNPPFSLAREYIACLVEYQKKFLIVGDMNWITYKEVFPLLKDNQIWLGNCTVKEFIQPDGTIKKFGNKLWFTNLDHKKRHEKLILWKSYTPEEYPTYDNYKAINVDKVSEIPCDYEGVMGVPITFLDKYNPDQFEIIGGSMYDNTPCRIIKNYVEAGYVFLKADGVSPSGSGALRDKMSPKIPLKGKSDYSVSPNGEFLSSVYQRIFIQRKVGN